MKAAIVNTTVDITNLQLSSPQDFVSQKTTPITKEYSVSYKNEGSTSSVEQKKSFEQMVKDIQNKDSASNVEDVQNQQTENVEETQKSHKIEKVKLPVSENLHQNEVESEIPEITHHQKAENLLNLLESGKIQVKDLNQDFGSSKVSKKDVNEMNFVDLSNELTQEEISLLNESVVLNFSNENALKISEENLINVEVDEMILPEEVLNSVQDFSVSSPSEFLSEFSGENFIGNEKIVSELKNSKKFALDKDGKIIVTDLRTKTEEVAIGNTENNNADFVTEVKFDGNNSAEMTLDLANHVQQNLTSSNTQSAAATNSNFQAMLTNQIQQNAYEFVKTGSIVLKDNDIGSIKLILHPESLGNVKIDLQISDNVINGKITVASQEAMNAFKDSIDSLKQAFLQSGYETSSFDLSMAGQNNSSSNFMGQHENSDARFQMARTYGEYSAIGEVSNDIFEEKFENSSKSAINIVA